MSYSDFFKSGLARPPSERRVSMPVSTSTHSRTPSDASMFYFTLRPSSNDYRSFLSLDIAELKRRSFSFSPLSPDSLIPDSPCLLPPPSPRALPSPKPAPMSSLPSIPAGSPNSHLHALDAPLSRSTTPVQRKASVASYATRASATSSTVSTHYRKARRNKALAALEGRRSIPTPKFEASGNFISLSEDEDDAEDEGLDLLVDHPYYVPEIQASHSASPYTTHFPSPTSMSPSRPEMRARRKTALGLQSFMDFQNEDEQNAHWSWRSFIEVST
ncbi:hypothetical protein MKEN_01405200 [Mycena kentingensis (nom. inval.)]|nr:hypothetical protein MKEN_01405200 [Mycena kentingensis (nom. inval.)]